MPFNIASYALLTMMVAQQTWLRPGEFVWNSGDTHLYLNHLDQARLQLTRTPFPLPVMVIEPRKRIDAYELEDFKLKGYRYHPVIKAPIAV